MEPLFAVEAGADVGQRTPPIVESPVMARLYEEAGRAAAKLRHFLVVGEPGVGKTTLARWIHTRTRRAGGPLVTLVCSKGDIPIEKAMFGRGLNLDRAAYPGAFECADGGTVVLEGVESLSLGSQARLLRVIEDRAVTRTDEIHRRLVDVRIVATTSADLGRAAPSATFRADLLYRLGGLTLRVPPLRERPEEIEPLALRFLVEAATGKTPPLSAEVLALFRSFPWPGNLNQLRDTVTKALTRCTGSDITPDHIDVEALRSESLPEMPNEEREERARIIAFLETGRVTDAAARLGIPRRTLIEKIKKYGFPRPRGRDDAN
jgi:DNA-binding NtrC family response regulator